MASVPPSPSTDVELLKFRLLTEMQAELTAWAKRRFSVLAIVVAVVGTFGFTTLLTQIIQALVSTNVKSSVDREINSLKGSIDTEILYARNTVERELSKIDHNLDRAESRLDDAIGRAAMKEASLDNATAAAKDAAAEVKDGLVNAQHEVEEARQRIRIVAQDAEHLQSDFHHLTENYGEFGEKLSFQVNKAQMLVSRNQKQIESVTRRIDKVETTVLHVISAENRGVAGTAEFTSVERELETLKNRTNVDDVIRVFD
jgi:chromosome segregation ATPase